MFSRFPSHPLPHVLYNNRLRTLCFINSLQFRKYWFTGASSAFEEIGYYTYRQLEYLKFLRFPGLAHLCVCLLLT